MNKRNCAKSGILKKYPIEVLNTATLSNDRILFSCLYIRREIGIAVTFILMLFAPLHGL